MNPALKLGFWIKEASRPFRRRYGLRALSRHASEAGLLQVARVKRMRTNALAIGITGSSGKSTTTALLSHILEGDSIVHKQIYENTYPEMVRTLSKLPKNADYLVVEVGATQIGSIRPMAELLKPDVALVMTVGLEHYSAFRSREAISQEKGSLIGALSPSGLMVLNADDPNVMSMAPRSRARLVTFGWSQAAQYRVVGSKAEFPDLLKLEIRWPMGEIVLQTPFLGEGFWLATAAAFAAAVELGIAPTVAAERIASFTPPWDRCGLIRTDGGPTFIVDTVKAPSESIPEAVAVLENTRAPFKRAIIGHIADYPGNPRKHYRRAYNLARAAADQVIFVGQHMHRAPATEADRANGSFMGFTTTKEVADHIQRTARADEIILLKGARNLHLERIALSWTHDVRCWELQCGKSISCVQCGMIETAYEEHGDFRRRERRKRLIFWRR